MKTKSTLFILLAGLVLAFDATARVFVATNSTWRYFKGTSEASTPTNAWRELAFDDSAWLTGSAPFHFGINAVGGDDNLTGSVYRVVAGMLLALAVLTALTGARTRVISGSRSAPCS